jgi:hypothetical protein
MGILTPTSKPLQGIAVRHLPNKSVTQLTTSCPTIVKVKITFRHTIGTIQSHLYLLFHLFLAKQRQQSTLQLAICRLYHSNAFLEKSPHHASSLSQPQQEAPRKKTAFTMDQFRGPYLATISREDVESLKGPKVISTSLIDVLLQRGMPKYLPAHALIGSSIFLRFLESMNKKLIDSTNRQGAKAVDALRRKYHPNSLHRHQFLCIHQLQPWSICL